MSILYDEGQQAIAEESRRVCAARHDKARALSLLEQTGVHDEGFWQTAIEQGWTGLALPEEHGGLGLSLIELGIVAQATGANTAGTPFLTTNDAAAHALLRGADDGLRQAWLPRLAAGAAIAAIALAEGSAALPPRALARLAEGALTGEKSGVTAGAFADFAIVWAREGDMPVLALAELTGAERTVVPGFDNSRGYADLAFANTPARTVARGADASRLAREVLARMAVVAAHEQVGGAEALLHIARDYAVTRKAFGQPIGAFQSIKHRIAELYGLIEIARANAIHAASREGRADFVAAAAAARISATEAYDTAARDTIQIHGGIGVTWETGLHLHMRRARSLANEAGSLFFWEDLLAEQLSGVAA